MPPASLEPGDVSDSKLVDQVPGAGKSLRLTRGKIAVLAMLVTYAVTFGAAWLTGPGLGGITGGVERISSTSANLVANLAIALPFGYAFAAGMVTAVNPCGFALLPTYLGLYLTAGQQAGAAQSLGRRARRAVHISAMVTSSFVLLFGLVGLVLSLTTSGIVRYLPWLGLAVGILMVLGAGFMLSGKAAYTSLGERVADRIGVRSVGSGSRGYLLYGLAYGTASLSCTLPIFLTVVGSALTISGFLPGVFDLVLYALGMGLVVTVLTVSMAFFKGGAVVKARSLSRYLEPLGAMLMLVGGAYIIFYWLTLGGLLTR